MKIKIELTFDKALALSEQIKEVCDEGKIELDFSSVNRIEPFAMLMVSSQLSRLKNRNPNAEISMIDAARLGYAGSMGFFKAFKETHKSDKASAGNSSFIPISILVRKNIQSDAFNQGIEVGNLVEGMCQDMAKMLCREEEGDNFDTLAYSMRELMRNVVEHSDSDKLAYCAQYWPSKNRVELAIIDRGIGLLKGLSPNPHINPDTDKEAINYALMPAISGKAYKGARKQRGEWINSGFGLYMTSRICRNGGTFLIASGKTAMLLTDKSDGKRYYDCDFEGTAIRMIIKTDKVNDLSKSLERYRDEGYEIQKRYKELVKIEPSAASMMLSRDFDLTLWDSLLRKVKGK